VIIFIEFFRNFLALIIISPKFIPLIIIMSIEKIQKEKLLLALKVDSKDNKFLGSSYTFSFNYKNQKTQILFFMFHYGNE